jgi:hypothetical protein
VTATVGAGGALVDLKFHTTRYRSMAPAELAAAVRDVVERARTRMAEEVAAAFQPMMPGRLRMREVIAGRVSVDDFLREAAAGRDGAGTANGGA